MQFPCQGSRIHVKRSIDAPRYRILCPAVSKSISRFGKSANQIWYCGASNSPPPPILFTTAANVFISCRTSNNNGVHIVLQNAVELIYTKKPLNKVKVEQTISKVITFSEPIQLNKMYNIIIHLGLTSVKFTATVEDWEETNVDTDNNPSTPVAPQQVDLPINVSSE